MVSGIGAGVSSIASQVVGPSTSAKPSATTSSFADVFKSAVSSVDSAQNSADQQVMDLLQGKSGANIGQVSVSVEKADVAFQLMMQVRNKVVSAYQDIEKMQF